MSPQETPIGRAKGYAKFSFLLPTTSFLKATYRFYFLKQTSYSRKNAVCLWITFADENLNAVFSSSFLAIMHHYVKVWQNRKFFALGQNINLRQNDNGKAAGNFSPLLTYQSNNFFWFKDKPVLAMPKLKK